MTQNSYTSQIARLSLELGIVENFLSDENYEMSGIDFDYESSLTDLAYHTQQERKNLKQKVSSLEEENAQLKQQIEILKGNKYKQHTYQYVYEDKLNPPSYIPSEDEIKLAKARYAFENEIWEIIYSLSMYIDLLHGKELQFPYTKEMVENEAKNSLEHWHTSLKKWNDDNDMWDCFIDSNWFKIAYIDSLQEYHGGDCTAFPASCPRCHAEAMFKINNTVTWGKAEGYRMEKAFFKDVKEKRELKEQEQNVTTSHQNINNVDNDIK